MKTETILTWGAVALAAYALWRLYGAVQAPAPAPAPASLLPAGWTLTAPNLGDAL